MLLTLCPIPTVIQDMIFTILVCQGTPSARVIKTREEKEEREMKFKKDLEYVKQNTTFSWVKNFFIDLKRTSGVNDL